jgi:hypothetical protein
MEEQVIGQGAGWKVTTTRVDIDGQTFATRNIGSVKVTGDGFPFGGFLLAGVACLVLITVLNAPTPQPGLATTCLLLGALGVYMIARKSGTKKLILVTGGGEVVALRSQSASAVEQLRDAVAQAIAQR